MWCILNLTFSVSLGNRVLGVEETQFQKCNARKTKQELYSLDLNWKLYEFIYFIWIYIFKYITVGTYICIS